MDGVLYPLYPNSKILVSSAGGDVLVSVSSDAATLVFTNSYRIDDNIFGTYDPSTDTFTPNTGTLADLATPPTVTPDGSVCTTATLNVYDYNVNGNMCVVSFQISADFDFSAGGNGTIEITPPYPTSTLVANGTVGIRGFNSLSGVTSFVREAGASTIGIELDCADILAGGSFNLYGIFQYQIN
jgi:hypothetical protein